MYQILDLIFFVILFLILTHKFNTLSINEKLVRALIFSFLIIMNRYKSVENFGMCYPNTNKASVYNSYKSNSKGWCTTSDPDDDSDDSGDADSDLPSGDLKKLCPGDLVTPAKKGTQTPLKSWCTDDGLSFEDSMPKPDELQSALIREKADTRNDASYLCETRDVTKNIHPRHDGPNIPK